MKLRKIVDRYIEAKRKRTECMSSRMKLHCSRCNKYNNCRTYLHYVDTWMKLQTACKKHKKI